MNNRIAALHTAYRNAHFAVRDVVVERDRAVVRWTFEGTHAGELYGKSATGKTVAISGMNMFCIEGERIAEIWVSADDLGELEQLGVVQLPAVAP